MTSSSQNFAETLKAACEKTGREVSISQVGKKTLQLIR